LPDRINRLETKQDQKAAHKALLHATRASGLSQW
jgi:hypothetical protein